MTADAEEVVAFGGVDDWIRGLLNGQSLGGMGMGRSVFEVRIRRKGAKFI